MDPIQLKAWMDRKGWNAVDVASALKIDPSTVKRFLNGGSAHRGTMAAYQRLMDENPAPMKAIKSVG